MVTFRRDYKPGERGRKHRGLTVIELLVVIGIIGILAGLALTGVQRARESARRVQCINNLKQIGIALQNYESGNGFFPSINSPTYQINGNPISAFYFSPLTRMLPQFEQAALYNSTNFTWPPAEPLALFSNHTVMVTSVDAFLCPSESSAAVPGYGRVNYRFNLGPTPWKAASDLVLESWTGPFTSHRFYRTSDFTDGLSNTIGVSERLQGNWDKQSLGAGDYLLTPIGNQKIGGCERAIGLCGKMPLSLPHDSRSGESWFLSGYHFTNYNHCMAPNARQFDCGFFPTAGDLHSRTIIEGLFTARSNHSSGVNVLTMDGSVHFAKDSINMTIWRDLATRAGGEIAGSESF